MTQALPVSLPRGHRDLTADTLRGVAILMVLVLHAIVMTDGIGAYPWLAKLGSRLGAGVQLFFVLSGYVITAAMDRARAGGDGASGFLLRRAAKLMPLYLLFLHLNILLFVAWSAATSDAQFFRNSVTAENLTTTSWLAHLAFAQGVMPGALNTLLDGDWSIVCEVYFYLLVPLVLHRVTRTTTGALWSLAGSLALACLFTLTIGKRTGTYGYYGFPAQLPCFVIGMLCYRLREISPGLRIEPAAQRAMGIALALLLFGFSDAYTAPLGAHVLVALLFAIALLCVEVRSARGIAGLLQWLGRQSYALFLLHLLLLKIAYSMIFVTGRVTGFWPVLTLNLAISLGATTLLSWAIFDPLDRACVRAMARYLSRRRKRA